jgi:HlyD family secretion protein
MADRLSVLLDESARKRTTLQPKTMKRTLVIVAVIIVAAIAIAIGLFAILHPGIAANRRANFQTEAARQDILNVTVDADGMVRSNQSALLTWETSGKIAQVGPTLGETVATGQNMAFLDSTTLPQSVILAQADLVEAQRGLENLLASQTKSAEARQKLEEAQQALEDGRDPSGIQSAAEQKAAEAQKALELAEDNYEIISKPASSEAIAQSKANLQIAEKILNDTLKNIERVNKKLRKDESDYLFFESRDLYKNILEGLENKRIRDQRKYEDALSRYNNLLEPPDPVDVAIAEGNVVLKRAELEQAQKELERIKDGLPSGDLAVLEARVADAQREWERWKDGPDPGEIAAARARIDAARANLNLVQILAPFDGVLTGVYAKEGDMVDSGSPAFMLDDLSRLLVDASVTEIDINKIEVGQPVILSFDAAPGREYNGSVVEVPFVGDTSQDIVTYKVVVEITDPDENIRPGITASAKIVTNSVPNALLVPNRALRISNGERVIYVLRDGRPTPVPLELGVASDAYTQVVGGDLKAGDLILLNPPTEASVQAGTQ